MEKVRQEADAADETDENEDPDAQQDYKDFKAWLDQSVAEGGSTVKLVGQKVVKIDKPVDTPNLSIRLIHQQLPPCQVHPRAVVLFARNRILSVPCLINYIIG